MAKYFLGSVGKAEAFRLNTETGERELAFVSKTLTDSGLNITTTKDDIRAGEGAPIQFSFYHDSNVEITLTDVLWKREYLEAQLGARFVDGSEDYLTDEVTFSGGTATFNKTVKALPFPCGEGDEYLVWGAKKGSDDWKLIQYSSNTLTLAGANGDYCIRYLGATDKAKEAEITSTIIPEELFLVITAPIFAGDACAASKGKAAGHITFEIPRFQLNGAQEFAMNMSQNQTMSLAGVALASESLECDANGGKLLRIIEVISNRSWKDDVASLIVDAESAEAGDKPSIYGVLKDGHLKALTAADGIEYSTNAGTSWTDLTAEYVFVASTDYIFRLKGTEAVSETVEIGA